MAVDVVVCLGERHLVRLVERILVRQGRNAIEAGSGEECLTIARNNAPVLIIADKEGLWPMTYEELLDAIRIDPGEDKVVVRYHEGHEFKWPPSFGDPKDPPPAAVAVLQGSWIDRLFKR